MSTNKISLIILLLTYLSGTFSLQRLNIGSSLDIRYVLAVLLLIFVLSSLNYSKIEKRYVNSSLVVLVLVFMLYTLVQIITLLYTPTPVESLEKIFDIIFIIYLVMMTALITHNMEAKEFFNTMSSFFICVGIVYVLPVLLEPIFEASRGDSFLSGPNVTTRILFFAFCSATYLKLRTENVRYTFLILIFLGGIIMVGSRGGMVAAVIILIIYFLLNLNIKKTIIDAKIKYRNIFITPIFILLAFLLYQPVKKVFQNRVIETTFSGDEIYTSGRDTIYTAALRLIEENPIFGNGVDSFTAITGYVYPHNLFLEMTLEIGVVGSIVFFLLLYYALKIIVKSKDEFFFIFSLLPFYMILVQMFSGEIYDFRYYFLFMIALITYKSSGWNTLSNRSNRS